MPGATALTARLADALALTGDCATAGRLADELLGSEDAAERAAAVRIAASIAVHDGSAGAGGRPVPLARAVSRRVRRRGGRDRVARRRRLRRPRGGAERRERRAADVDRTRRPQPRRRSAAVARSAVPVAVARLGQSITAEQQPTGVAPDTPAALVTLAALHGGDPVRARSVIGRAVRAGQRTAQTNRLRPPAPAAARLGEDAGRAAAPRPPPTPPPTADATLHRRDALWAAALQTAIARRSGDSGAVQKHWYAAMEVLAEYSMDLFSLLPLGELWVAAARMRQVDRLQHTLDEAFALLESLGNPLLWSVPLHWAGVHAGILANSPEAVAPHGQALTAAAAQSAFAKALATRRPNLAAGAGQPRRHR